VEMAQQMCANGVADFTKNRTEGFEMSFENFHTVAVVYIL